MVLISFSIAPPLPAIRLNSLQYSQLKDKLQAPIRTARHLMVHQSLGDRFQAAFAEQVDKNGVYQLPSGSSVSVCVCVCVCVCVFGDIGGRK